MTRPEKGAADSSRARLGQWLRPRVALPVLVVVVVLVAVLTPEDTNGRSGDSRLTTFSTNAQGGRALYDLAHRLGWKVERQLARGTPRYGANAIRAVLDPAQELTATETHEVLEDVRRGGALLAVINPGRGPLADSLGARTWYGSGYSAATGIIEDDHEDEKCDEKASQGLTLWPNQQVTLFALRWPNGAPSDTTIFATVDVGHALPGTKGDAGGVKAAAAGFPFGKGRVVVVSDPDLLRNDVLRLCEWHTDVVAVRMLEYLTPGASGARSRIVFDEYHQGFGTHPGSLRAIAMFLGSTGSGRTLLQLLAAALVLLGSAAARPLPPPKDQRAERRSPLEHVDALARAYDRVHATRTVTRRLLHGIRRRAALRNSGAAMTDDEYLGTVADRYPILRDDIATVRRALTETGSRHDLDRAGEALERIEATLTPTTTP